MIITPEYKAQMSQLHRDSAHFGCTGWKYAGPDIIALLEKRAYIETVLDFGAGKGRLGQNVKDSGWSGKWVNYDPGMPEYGELPACQFDLVITTDVLEHVEIEHLGTILKTLGSLTKKVLYNFISCVDTGKYFADGPYKGKDLHMIVKSPKWWREQFQHHTGLTEFYYRWEEYIQRGRPTTRCLMIHERT